MKERVRIDAFERVTGQAQYTGDIQLPNMLHGRVLRSPHPHARILSIDISDWDTPGRRPLWKVLSCTCAQRSVRCFGIATPITSTEVPRNINSNIIHRKHGT
jgi:hypothetical protein